MGETLQRVDDEGGGLPLRDSGVPCQNCGTTARRPNNNRCAGCGRWAPDPRYAYSEITGTWYRVWQYDDLGNGQIVAKEKESVDVEEVPEVWIEAMAEHLDKETYPENSGRGASDGE